MGVLFWASLGTGLGVITFLTIVLVFVPGRVGRSISRSEDLERTFGEEEYIHTLEAFGTWKGEQTLARWKAEALALSHPEIDDQERRRFIAAWASARRHFADSPEAALDEMDRLVAEIEAALGYPTDEFEHTEAILSVDHPGAAHHLRAAHAVADRARRHEASPAELDAAVSEYEAAISELVSPGDHDRELAGVASQAPARVT